MQPLNIEGIGNGWILDGRLWRGAQPADEAFVALADAGCKTVIDLNNTGTELDRQKGLAKAEEMEFIGLEWSDFLPPTQNQLVHMFGVMASFQYPFFLHCLHGSDRTGTACSVYRMAFDDYTFTQATEEQLFKLGAEGTHEVWMIAAAAQWATDHGVKI